MVSEGGHCDHQALDTIKAATYAVPGHCKSHLSCRNWTLGRPVDRRCWRLRTQLLIDTPFTLRGQLSKHAGTRREHITPAASGQCPLSAKLSLFSTGEGKHIFKELTSIFPEQALKGGFGTLRQYAGSWHESNGKKRCLWSYGSELDRLCWPLGVCALGQTCRPGPSLSYLGS